MTSRCKNGIITSYTSKEDVLVMKRILCILLGISLLLGTVSFAWAEEDGEEG